MDAKESDLEREADRDIAAFEAWFTARPNQPLSPFEIAILKTYVWWVHHERPAPSQP
jgi:hypothetical protein